MCARIHSLTLLYVSHEVPHCVLSILVGVPPLYRLIISHFRTTMSRANGSAVITGTT